MKGFSGCMYLCDHHVAVECPPAAGLSRTLDVGPNLANDGSSNGHVGDEVTVHDVYVQPVGTLGHLGGAFTAQGGEICAQNRRRDNCGGSHDAD